MHRSLYSLSLATEDIVACVINLNKQDGETRVAIFIRFKFICEFKAIQIYLSMHYFMTVTYYWPHNLYISAPRICIKTLLAQRCGIGFHIIYIHKILFKYNGRRNKFDVTKLLGKEKKIVQDEYDEYYLQHESEISAVLSTLISSASI